MTLAALEKWQPLLDGAVQARALTVADEIAGELQTRARKLVRDGSLASGHAGLAVAFAYLDQVLPGRGYGDAAAIQRDAAIDYLGAAPMAPGLFGGFTGIAWAAARLDCLAGPLDGEQFADVDHLLSDMLSTPHWNRHYDLMSGLVGLGVYAIERLPDPLARKNLTHIVGLLSRWAERQCDGVSWHTPTNLLSAPRRSERPDGEYNLGLAHGTPGAIAVLAQASSVGVSSNEIDVLVDGAVRWLLAQQLPHSPGASFGYEARSKDSRIPARSAWCYGDLGVAAALLCAARCRGNAEWERHAIDLAAAAASRPEHQMQINDAGLCHGWAGLAHVFNRMYQTSCDARLADAARRFCQRTLECRRADRGVAGYAAWLSGPSGRWGWRDEPGLLEGAAGVAVTLGAAASDVAPFWDSIFLISNRVDR